MFLSLLGDVQVSQVREEMYAVRVHSQLQNVYRFIFITCDCTGANTTGIVTIQEIIPITKSIQFIEFDAEPEFGSRLPTIDYVTLVAKLDPIRKISIKRFNIVNKPDSGSTKISEYESPEGTVLLFHKTESDFEYVPNGNLLAAVITFNTLIYPEEYRSIYSLPVYNLT